MFCFFKDEETSPKKVSIQDQPAGESQATTPQSAAVEEGTGDSKGIENNKCSKCVIMHVLLRNFFGVGMQCDSYDTIQYDNFIYAQ